MTHTTKPAGLSDDGTERNRRSFLRGAGAVAVGLSTTGCLDALSFGSTGATDDVVLDPPERYEQLREARDAGGIDYPIHGDPMPDVTVPAPITGREVRTTEFVGDRHALFTFVFTRCPGICLLLTSNLAQVQVDAIEQGYADEVALLPVTFDPEHDTADVLEPYAADRGVDHDAGNWWFLRPKTPERAEEVVGEAFGVYFAPLTPEQREERGMHEEMHFEHLSAIVLANADGYVERTYTGSGIPEASRLRDDVRTLRERW